MGTGNMERERGAKSCTKLQHIPFSELILEVLLVKWKLGGETQDKENTGQKKPSCPLLKPHFSFSPDLL